MAGLSTSDAAVVSALFDPEASLRNSNTNGVSIAAAPSAFHSPSTTTDAEARIRNAVALVNSETPARESIARALGALDGVIASLLPAESQGGSSREILAEAYINRAQTRRLLLDWPANQAMSAPRADEDEDEDEGIDAVVHDLSRAISLLDRSAATSSSSGSGAAAQASVSARAARGLAAAYTHRAYIFHTLSRSPPLSPLTMTTRTTSPAASDEQSKSREPSAADKSAVFEEQASRDFAQGARYGDPIARKMSVVANPYAKLCGGIVREALLRERASFTPPPPPPLPSSSPSSLSSS